MLPFVDTTKMTGLFGEGSALGDVLDRVATFSASNLTQATIFGLGIMPYISASIIFQLLGTVWEPLERLQKEGESGGKNQRIHAICHGRHLPGAELVLGQPPRVANRLERRPGRLFGQRPSGFRLENHRRVDDDGGHHLPDVARGTD